MRTLLALGIAALVVSASASIASGAPATLRLAREPYAGVRCPRPNSIACDRIGLAVWLLRPAERLTATIAGKSVQMTIPDGIRYGRGTYYGARGAYFEGSLQSAGLLAPGPLHVKPDRGAYWWAGRRPRVLRVRLVAFYRDGTRASTAARTWLHAGWG